jgi:AcrR family transcriptional regulator
MWTKATYGYRLQATLRPLASVTTGSFADVSSTENDVIRAQALDEEPTSRSAIVEAAKQCFARSGFRGASVKQIAATAGIGTSGLIYYYFPSKVELFAAVLVDAVAERYSRYIERLSTCQSLGDALRCVSDETFKAWREDPALVQLILSYPTELRQNPELADRFEHQSLDRVWPGLLGDRNAARLVPTGMDATTTRDVFLIWFTGLTSCVVTQDVDSMQRASDAFIDILDRGIRNT